MSIWTELLTALVRALVQVVVGFLVAHGIVSAEQAGHFTTELTLSIVAGVILFLATYGASAWNKIKAKNRLFMALISPSDASEKEVVATADALPISQQIKIATSPGT